jgi:hypothetical protein
VKRGRGRPRGTASTPERDREIIDAVMKVWNRHVQRNTQAGLISEVLRLSFRSNDPARNVFAIASKSVTHLGLNRSVAGFRKAFDAAWARQCPNERKPSVERRKVYIRMCLRMQGAKLPRRWREPPFVPDGDRDSNPNTPRLIWAESKS